MEEVRALPFALWRCAHALQHVLAHVFTDEVNSIVVDVGSYTCKAGYGGEDSPKAVFPSVCIYNACCSNCSRPCVRQQHQPFTHQQCVGYVPGHPPPDVDMEDAANGAAPKRRKRSVYVGLAAANHRRDNMEVSDDVASSASPHATPPQILPCLKEGMYDNMDHIAALWDHAFFDRLRVDPREHPILLAEPTANTKELREAQVSLMFEV